MCMKKFITSLLFLFLCETSYAAIRINEIAWSGTPESANNEWIELFNDGEEALSLENWQLTALDGSPQILLTGTIEPNGFFVLERTDDTTIPHIPANQLYTGSLSNTGETLILKDGTGTEIDQTPSGEWIAGESSPERRSMMWIENGWETFQGEASEGIFGSPGEINSISDSEEITPPARPKQIRITELSPTAIGEPEWFEVEMIADKEVDFTNWIIRRGNQKVPFSSLTIETGLEETPIRFLGDPSPISLPNDGGTLEIIDQEEVLTSVTWEKTKSGTKDTFSWGEIWNWGETKYWPWRSFENKPTHTKGQENKIPPAFPEELIIRIDEIAPNRTDGGDFIEILVSNVPEGKVLPPWNIKNNGTELFAGGGESVSNGDRITLFLNYEKIQETPARWRNQTVSPNISTTKTWDSSSKNGLNKTSGTLELNIWTDTSWEQTADFICWAQEELSETEKKRRDAKRENWNGTCFKNKLLPNESIARPMQSNDTNGANDFFRHFNGSPQKQNLPLNNPPIPKIMIQGGKKVYETSLNLTGLDGMNATTDPDGIHDIKSWQWTIEEKNCGNYEEDHWEWSTTRNGSKTCSEESINPNPGRIYFNFQKQEFFNVTLTVEDFSGETKNITVKLNRDPFHIGGSGGSVFNAPLKKWIEKELAKNTPDSQKKVQLGHHDATQKNFFDEFLEHLDYTYLDPRWFRPQIPPKIKLKKIHRDKFSPETLQRARKNIGVVFLY